MCPLALLKHARSKAYGGRLRPAALELLYEVRRAFANGTRSVGLFVFFYTFFVFFLAFYHML